jgi:uncharacterized protein
MAEYLWLVPVGFIAGTFGTLIGAGGGFILMPILLVWHKDWNADTLTAISLAMICGNSISGSVAYARMRRINYYAGVWFAAAAIPGSLLGAYATDYIPRQEFYVFFGIFLLAASLYLVCWPGKLREHTTSHVQFNFWFGVVMSFFVGVLSSLLGLGGGIIHVPVMIYWLNFPVHIATATSHFVLAMMTLSATIFHIFMGHLTGKYMMALMLIIGVIFGAQFGARLSTKVSGKWIVRGLAIALMMAAARILWMEFT